MNLVRYTSPRSVDTIDRVFHELTSGWFTTPRPGSSTRPEVRVRHVENGLQLSVDLPGVPREAISVDVTERVLSIAVEHRDEGETLSWSHRVTLGGSLNPDAVSARYLDGRLTVQVPTMPQAPGRRVDID